MDLNDDDDSKSNSRLVLRQLQRLLVVFHQRYEYDYEYYNEHDQHEEQEYPYSHGFDEQQNQYAVDGRWLLQSAQEEQQQEQQQQRQLGAHREQLLFILYLCLLICCCVTPFVYYIRLFLWQRVRLRQLRELEHAGLMAILQQTMLNNERYGGNGGGGDPAMAESTMVQQERKARIKQMMEPVRKVLESNDFRDVDPTTTLGDHNSSAAAAIVQEIPTAGTVVRNTNKMTSQKDLSMDETSTSCGEDTTEDGFIDQEADQQDDIDDHDDDNDDDDHDDDNERRQIRVPPPGIVFLRQQQQQHQQQLQKPPPSPEVTATSTSSSAWLVNGPAFPAVVARWNDPERFVPASCPICLSSYVLGSIVVWSSNAQCHHVFHADCMEMWLLKQHEEPICPCCRREFLVDPYDLIDNAEEEMMEIGGGGGGNGTTAGTGNCPDPDPTTFAATTEGSSSNDQSNDVLFGRSTTSPALSNRTDPEDHGLPGV